MDDAIDGGRPNEMSDPDAVHHEWGPPERPSLAVVEAVAATTGRAPTDLAPLQRRLDVDALDELVTAAQNNDRRVQISVTYEGVDVLVDSRDGVTVYLDERGGE